MNVIHQFLKDLHSSTANYESGRTLVLLISIFSAQLQNLSLLQFQIFWIEFLDTTSIKVDYKSSLLQYVFEFFTTK